jgi:hypothetical protein
LDIIKNGRSIELSEKDGEYRTIITIALLTKNTNGVPADGS